MGNGDILDVSRQSGYGQLCNSGSDRFCNIIQSKQASSVFYIVSVADFTGSIFWKIT